MIDASGLTPYVADPQLKSRRFGSFSKQGREWSRVSVLWIAAVGYVTWMESAQHPLGGRSGAFGETEQGGSAC